MLTFTFSQYGSTWPLTMVAPLKFPLPLPLTVAQEPGAALVVPPAMYVGANSPWPTLMPPDSVPALFLMRLFAISRLWFQPCRNTAPPPCELSVMLRPLMLEGLQ